jgi:hypothetical protein
MPTPSTTAEGTPEPLSPDEEREGGTWKVAGIGG